MRGDEEDISKAEERLSKAENSKATKRASEYKDLLERSKAMTEKIIEESLKKGYSIHSRDVMRAVNVGHSAAASALLTAGGVGLSALTGVGAAVSVQEYAPGMHYRVKNDGLGTRTHRSRKFASDRPRTY